MVEIGDETSEEEESSGGINCVEFVVPDCSYEH
jgi:hypothetical protein